ncbi:MAG TPA: antitoxin VapB family protein [Kiritimatiellia bacterium]|nr:antitoxin VapB family protein [Kiritimatiellia bacterium]HMP34474.1 antitoxin VapB family protein [Kiritimatiellia bacterium]
MAVKTITIDMDAYTLLEAEKRAGESFSKVIKRTLGGGSRSAADLMRQLDRVMLEESTLARLEGVVRDRARHPVQALRWEADPR